MKLRNRESDRAGSVRGRRCRTGQIPQWIVRGGRVEDRRWPKHQWSRWPQSYWWVRNGRNQKNRASRRHLWLVKTNIKRDQNTAPSPTWELFNFTIRVAPAEQRRIQGAISGYESDADQFVTRNPEVKEGETREQLTIIFIAWTSPAVNLGRRRQRKRITSWRWWLVVGGSHREALRLHNVSAAPRTQICAQCWHFT